MVVLLHDKNEARFKYGDWEAYHINSILTTTSAGFNIYSSCKRFMTVEDFDFSLLVFAALLNENIEQIRITIENIYSTRHEDEESILLYRTTVDGDDTFEKYISQFENTYDGMMKQIRENIRQYNQEYKKNKIIPIIQNDEKIMIMAMLEPDSLTFDISGFWLRVREKLNYV